MREVEFEIICPICAICHVIDDGYAEATTFEMFGLFLFLGHVLSICYQTSPERSLCSTDLMVENHDCDRRNL